MVVAGGTRRALHARMRFPWIVVAVLGVPAACITVVADDQSVDDKSDQKPATIPPRVDAGIDAPESDMYWGDRATEYMRARALNRPVTLRLESTQTRDRYKRLLAYVYLSDTDCLNLDVIRDGQAYADRRFRHTFRPQFEMAEAEARKKKRGLWKDLRNE